MKVKCLAFFEGIHTARALNKDVHLNQSPPHREDSWGLVMGWLLFPLWKVHFLSWVRNHNRCTERIGTRKPKMESQLGCSFVF